MKHFARLLLIGVAALASFTAWADSRPNFLVIHTDDVAESMMPHAPQTLAEIGQRGVRFNRSYVQQPACTPSRNAFFTGQYNASHDVRGQWHASNSGYPGSQRNLGRHYGVQLLEAGYATGFVGHFIVAWARFENTATFRPPGWERFIGSPGGNSRDGGVFDNGRSRSYTGGGTKAFFGYAREIINDAGTRPWVVQVSTHDAHTPYTPSPAAVAAIPTLRYPRDAAFNVPGLSFPPFLARSPMTAPQIAAEENKYLGGSRELRDVDNAIGSMLAWLQQRGQLANTYVIWTSDNGYRFGDHAIRPFSPPKTLTIETDIRVPLLIRGPGVAAGMQEGRLVSSVDVPATILSAAGIALPSYMEERSLVPLLRSQPTAWRTAVPYRLWNHPAGFGVRTERYTYFETNTGAQKLLFDNEADPFQLRNVVEQNPILAGRLSALARDFRACRGAQCRIVDARPAP